MSKRSRFSRSAQKAAGKAVGAAAKTAKAAGDTLGAAGRTVLGIPGELGQRISTLVEVRAREVGASPGTLEFTGRQRDHAVTLSVLQYDEAHLAERAPVPAAELASLRGGPGVLWINLDGVHDTALVQQVGDAFGIHPLVLENIVATDQRPKFEDHDSYVFLSIKMIICDAETRMIVSEQVSLVMMDGVLISFLEDPGDIWEPVRTRIRTSKGKIRRCGADYLLYALVDAIVDHYFVVLEQLGEAVEGMDIDLINNPSQESMQVLQRLKGEAMVLRKSVWPLREVIGSLERLDSPLIQAPTRAFLRDVYDHTIQTIDSIETFREVLGMLMDTYLSSLSHRMNEVMKTLTIFASIFMPITFMAGIYGMNFDNIPELHHPYGYFILLGAMAATTCGMLLFFRHKKWI